MNGVGGLVVVGRIIMIGEGRREKKSFFYHLSLPRQYLTSKLTIFKQHGYQLEKDMTTGTPTEFQKKIVYY